MTEREHILAKTSMKTIYDIYCKWHGTPSYLKRAGRAVYSILFNESRFCHNRTGYVLEHIERGIDDSIWNQVLKNYDSSKSNWILEIKKNNINKSDIEDAAFVYTVLNEINVIIKCCELL